MSLESNERTMQRVVAHHRAMTDELEQRVTELGRAVDEHAEGTTELDAVREYLASELLPHARAEEGTMYRAASQEDLKTFVEGMIAEHRFLAGEGEKLSKTRTAPEGLEIARGIASTFAEHARKENEVLLPALASDPACDLAGLLEDMHAILGD
ncbi:MAG: hemerythrin domain-containing protein [Actinomycetota bacterium]